MRHPLGTGACCKHTWQLKPRGLACSTELTEPVLVCLAGQAPEARLRLNMAKKAAAAHSSSASSSDSSSSSSCTHRPVSGCSAAAEQGAGCQLLPRLADKAWRASRFRFELWPPCGSSSSSDSSCPQEHPSRLRHRMGTCHCTAPSSSQSHAATQCKADGHAAPQHPCMHMCTGKRPAAAAPMLHLILVRLLIIAAGVVLHSPAAQHQLSVFQQYKVTDSWLTSWSSSSRMGGPCSSSSESGCTLLLTPEAQPCRQTR